MVKYVDYSNLATDPTLIMTCSIHPVLLKYYLIIIWKYLCVCCRHWKYELERKKAGKKPRLLLAVLKCLYWRLLMHGTLMFLEVQKKDTL